MRKGVGPRELGVPKGVGKMYGAKSPATQIGRNLAEVADKKRVKADKAKI